ncbi:hypothetical protein CKA38_09095 [Ereboglobus luteus]|uniref:Calcineurin-like phosphoesterase domain-containing protein n=2 Tax=Ereboglobus luteus TaxID=1796921 RepID=A0A2U8E3J3_9BACT|nr:hypothetical protein CKA38_09095 [Ereboglobus luteus]
MPSVFQFTAMTSPVKKLHTLILIAFLLTTSVAFSKVIIKNDFEKGVPREYSPDKNFKISTDTAYARSGKASLHLAKNAGATSNAVYYDLDGRMDFVDACEFSVWVYTKSKTRVAIYISTDDGGGRYNVAEAYGTLTPGKWCQMKGVVHAGDWRKQDQQTRFVIRSYGECWVDDVSLETSTTATPAQAWPRLKAMIQSRTAKRISTVKLGDTLTLDARNAVLAPDTARVEVSLPDTASTIIPEEGLLVFAINATEDLALTGSLQLEPDADLRPGLRVTVLADDTVIAAPAVKAKAWKGTQSGNRPGPAPNIKGERPSSTVPLAPFRLSKGRHYITVAGPHIRSGGTFAKLELQAGTQPAEKPLYTFGLLSDTHLGSGRPEWINLKLNAQAGAELEAALRQLKREGAGFAIIAGDMTDAGRRSQYDELSRIVKRANLPVYGCLGNHDTFRDSRKKDIAETIPKLFPDGPTNTDYAFSKAPCASSCSTVPTGMARMLLFKGSGAARPTKPPIARA